MGIFNRRSKNSDWEYVKGFNHYKKGNVVIFLNELTEDKCKEYYGEGYSKDEVFYTVCICNDYDPEESIKAENVIIKLKGKKLNKLVRQNEILDIVLDGIKKIKESPVRNYLIKNGVNERTIKKHCSARYAGTFDLTGDCYVDNDIVNALKERKPEDKEPKQAAWYVPNNKLEEAIMNERAEKEELEKFKEEFSKYKNNKIISSNNMDENSKGYILYKNQNGVDYPIFFKKIGNSFCLGTIVENANNSLSIKKFECYTDFDYMMQEIKGMSFPFAVDPKFSGEEYGYKVDDKGKVLELGSKAESMLNEVKKREKLHAQAQCK